MTNLSALKPDTLVGTYKIIQAVDSNSYSVIYRARIDDTDEEILLQEFVPNDLVRRHRDDHTVQPQRGKDKIFEEGLALFLQEARVLSQIRDPYVARVREYTEARGTAFLAMDLEQGQSLDEHLNQVGKLGEKELRQLFIPLLKGLRVIHAADLLHRDINPKNVFIRDAGPPLILGFGSTQRALRAVDIGLESRVTPGFSPIEQYHEDGRVGPWTDLYALGAVLYKCTSGITPVDAPKRVTAIAEGKEDPLVPAMEIGHGEYHTSILSCIDWLLQPVIDKRPASAGAILGPLAEPHRKKAAKDEPKKLAPIPQEGLKLDGAQLYSDPSVHVGPDSEKRSRNVLAWVTVVLLVIGIGTFAFWPQIEPFVPGLGRETAQSPTTIEGTSIPNNILDQPLPDKEQPPELPKSLELTRKADNFRADEYRRIEQYDNTIRTLLKSAETRIRDGKLIAPPRDNALEDYRAILIIDIDNVDALQGIDQIAGLLLAQARSEFEKGELENAQETLDAMQGAGIQTDDTLALKLEIKEQYDLMAFEQQRIEQDRDETEQERQAEEARQREEKLIEEQSLAEEERLRQEQLAEQQRLAEEERLKQEQLAEQQRLAEEARLREEKLIEEQRLAEEERLRQEQLAEQQRLAEEERLKQEQLAVQQRLAEAARQREEKLIEEQRLAEEERLRQEQLAEQQRLAEEERLKQEQLAAEKIKQQELAEQARLKKAQDGRIAGLLATAQAAVGTGFTDSSVETALASYREVLTLDPQNSEARQGVSEIVKYYVDLANKALGKDQFREVENLLLLISAIDPQSKAVDLLSDQMEIRRQAIVQAQLQAQKEEELAKAAQAELQKQKELELEQRMLEQGIRAYYRGDYQTAFEILRPLAEKGKERAQFRVGVMYLRGRGTTKDPTTGTAWIRRAFPAVQSAATSGEAWAQSDLGSLYHDGLLVAQNDKEAARWYMLAAEQGYPGAQTNLGTMYANGEGVGRSRSEAIKWLKRAAAQGDKIAQKNLVALGAQ